MPFSQQGDSSTESLSLDKKE